MRAMLATWLGRVPYASARALQARLAARRAAGELPDVLLLLEHEPVYTLGRRAPEAEILIDRASREARGIAVERTDRGGLVTYHGPGQLVGYPIVDLGPACDVLGYVGELEEALASALADLGIAAGTVEGLRGVWVGEAKIAAIGVHVSRGITTHGFALNVDCDLDAFNGIVPCGIVDRGVTSIAALAGAAPPVAAVGRLVARHLARTMARQVAFVEPAALGIEEAAARRG
ncbi:MAG: lipoyl(octanoyl) transferase LipB [Acidobacteria bacterium]|nr:lipoyl(octanoyl) transferase LipB [Acidobacteriota bacterium]